MAALFLLNLKFHEPSGSMTLPSIRLVFGGIINARLVFYMLSKTTDAELIRRYVQEADQQAFEQLMARYHDTTYRRFLKRCKNVDDAADLTQQLWINMVTKLDNYQDEGKFAAFLTRSASNLLTDYWRHKGVVNRVMVEDDDDADLSLMAKATNAAPDPLENIQLYDEINTLTRELIPALPCEQRLAWLLRHESEFWEEKRPLKWDHLAELNGIDEETAWQHFEDLRNKLIAQVHPEAPRLDLQRDCEQVLVFLVWTQAQRLSKKQDFTWDYLADLLGITSNALKLRYRKALASLKEGLSN
jgi:RNA polymerase sigma-70 factor (ECF subfamily)